MTDTAQLEQQILAEVAAAGDEAALEAVRVAALGKNGSITALLKTLGTLPPEERKTQGPLINGLKDRVNAALAARRDAFKGAALAGAAQHRKRRRHAAGARSAGRDRPRASDHAGDRRIDGDLRRHGLCRRRRSRHRDRRLQLHQAQFSGRPSGARHARHVLLQSEAGRHAASAAHPHLAGAGAHHAERRSRRSASSFPAAPIAATPTRRTRRCFIRSRASSSTRARISAT